SSSGLLNPGLDPVRLPRVDQRSYLDLEREGVANTQRSDTRGKTLHELGLDVGMHENALGRDAHLTGMIVAAFDYRLDHLVEVGTAVDNRRGGPAMLQGAARARCQLAVQIPSDA